LKDRISSCSNRYRNAAESTKKYSVSLLICIAIAICTVSSIPRINTNAISLESTVHDQSSCIKFDAATRVITVACTGNNNKKTSLNFTDVNNVLHDPKILHRERSLLKIWFLNANLLIKNASKFYINSTDTDWLKINSTAGHAYTVESRGSLVIDSVRITSWDTIKHNYGNTNSDGTYPRSSIFLNANNDSLGATANITKSEIAYLGYKYPHRFGLTYYGGAGSNIQNSKIHHLWYGFYSDGSHNIIIENNKFYNNTLYGIDPHSKSHDLTIRNNSVYNNGKHGIICSTDCYNITIEMNKVFCNAQNGITLYRNVTDSVIRYNTVYDNKNDQISLNYGYRNAIYNNNIKNGEFGIRISNESSNNLIHNNIITNQSKYGFYALEGSSQNKISSNTIINASIYALYVQDPTTSNNIFAANQLSENKQDAIRLYNLGNKSGTLFINNTIGDTKGYDYSITRSRLNLLDEGFDSKYLKSTSNEDTVTLTYSYLYIFKNLQKVMSTPLSASNRSLFIGLLGVTHFLFFTNPVGYFPTIEYSIPHKAALVQYRQGPVIKGNSNLKIETVFDRGLNFPTAIAFLGPNDFLVSEKNNGTLQRIVDGKMLAHPVLDVNVANKAERGMLGLAIAKNMPEHENTTYVFVYYTESNSMKDGDDECPVPTDVCKPNHDPLGNRLYRYELRGDKLINPKLLLDLPATPGPIHNGGKTILGPDNNLYVTVGDLGRHNTKAENFLNGSEPDGTGGILRITQDGQIVKNGPFARANAEGETSGANGHSMLKYYYAYGIRNSFGLDFDPVTKKLWDTENGPNFGDEINLVDPGFNSGWRQIQGIWKPIGELKGSIILNPSSYLVNFNGTTKTYHSPKFIWEFSTGLTAIKFLNSDKLGKQYKDNMFVGDFHTGTIYRFILNKTRTGISDLKGPLADKIANSHEETNNIVFAQGFGGITDIEVNPYDGYLYILALQSGGGSCDPRFTNKPCISFNSSIGGTVFRVVPKSSDDISLLTQTR
jgi:aldose sugar dehydrogenase